MWFDQASAQLLCEDCIIALREADEEKAKSFILIKAYCKQELKDWKALVDRIQSIDFDNLETKIIAQELTNFEDECKNINI